MPRKPTKSTKQKKAKRSTPVVTQKQVEKEPAIPKKSQKVPEPEPEKAPEGVLVDPRQVFRAATAILKLHSQEEQSTKKKSLFDDSKFISLNIALNKYPPKTNLRALPIVLPFPIFDAQTEICVFVKDPVEKYKPMLKAIPGVKKVIAISKLRANYKQFDTRRKLKNSYDLFLCDDSISLVLISLLGKAFIKSKKMPVPIKFKHDLQSQVSRALKSTFLYLPRGTCANLHVGTTASHTPKQIQVNMMACLEKVPNRIPWELIQSLSIRTSTSIALPFFNQIVRTESTQKDSEIEEKPK
jgi:ribosome biogenesis protein UTP30